ARDFRAPEPRSLVWRQLPRALARPRGPEFETGRFVGAAHCRFDFAPPDAALLPYASSPRQAGFHPPEPPPQTRPARPLRFPTGSRARIRLGCPDSELFCEHGGSFDL